MRKLILYIATSLDGYIADINGKIDWLTQYGNEDEVASDTSYQELMKRIDTVLMGRTTYDQIVNELMGPADEYFYSGLKNYVFTTREAQSRRDVEFINQNAAEFVRMLKAQAGKDIWLIGGARLVHDLIKEKLIDEFQITLVPTLLGDGIRLFEKDEIFQKLKLTNTRKVGQLVYLTYVRKY